MTTQKAVSERALIKRCNRRLKSEGLVMKKTRGSPQAFLDLGYLWVLDVSTNFVSAQDICLETWARDLGALKEWERLEQ